MDERKIIMSKIPYQKPFQTGSELCDKLILEGMIINDITNAAKSIENFSYYRFKAYLIPFRIPTNKNKFLDHTTFEGVKNLYYFDEALRELLFGFIQKVEVLLRSMFDRHIAQQTQNNFWYLDSALFKDNKNVHGTVNTVRSYFLESSEEFAQHFRQKYFNPYCPFYRDLPPSWVAIELMSFGNLKKFMEAIAEDKIVDLKLDRFARKIGCSNYQTLLNWIALIHEVRNCCCHHARVFNRNFSAPAGIKSRLSKNISLVKCQTAKGGQEEQLNRIYSCLVILQILLNSSVYKNIVGKKLQLLFQEHQIALEFLPSMGIPKDWQQEPLFFA